MVREAERDGCTVRAVGSGHSWSDVALTDGILVHPGGLSKPLDLEAELLRAHATDAHEGNDGVTLVRVQAGMTIAKLNAHLRALKLALPNMGGFDGQTVAGVISTSTHGSGIGYGPMSDLVRSLDIVGPGGKDLPDRARRWPDRPRRLPRAIPRTSAQAGRPLVPGGRRGYGLHGLDLLGDPRRAAAVLPARGPHAEHVVAGAQRTGARRGAGSRTSITSCSSTPIRTSGVRSNASSPPAIRWLPRNIATTVAAVAAC